MKIGTRILLGYGAALVVFIVVSVVSYRATSELIQSTEATAHTYQVRQSLSGIIGSLTDAETGQRGYLLTGREEYLEPYNNGTRSVDQYVQDLRRLTSDNPNQQTRINALQPLIAEKLSELAETIQYRRQQNEKEALDIVLTNRGRQYMVDIRRILTDMENEEIALLAKRTQKASETANFASQTIIIGTLVSLVLIIALALVIQRSIVGPLVSFMDLARRVGEGDLTQQAKIEPVRRIRRTRRPSRPRW